MKKIKFLVLSLLTAFSFTSCSDDSSGGGSSKDLVEIASERNDLTTFVLALQMTGIDATVDGPESFTIYAPINSAWDDFLTQNGYASINAVPIDILKQIVYNHITQGDVDSEQILTGYKKTLAKGSASSVNFLNIYMDKTSTTLKLNGTAEVIVKDIDAKNGKLNTISHVLGLPTVLDHIKANSDLDKFEAALIFNPDSGFSGLLSGTDNSPFTVIAPVNDGFTQYLEEMEYENLGEIPTAELEEILQYHIVSGQNALSSTFVNGQSFATMSGQNFTLTLTGGGKKITDVNSRVGTMQKTDIQCANGVIHTLDKVLLPTL